MSNDPSKIGASASYPAGQAPRKTADELIAEFRANRPKAFREADVADATRAGRSYTVPMPPPRGGKRG